MTIILDIFDELHIDINKYVNNELSQYKIINYDDQIIRFINELTGHNNFNISEEIYKIFDKHNIIIDHNKYIMDIIEANQNDKYLLYSNHEHKNINISNINIKRILIADNSHEGYKYNYDYVYYSVDNFINDVEKITDDDTMSPLSDDIIEEITADNEENKQTIREPEKITYDKTNYNNTTKLTISSFALGKQGEEYIANMINDIRPMYSVHIVANTGHLADIHVDDEERNIKYIIEVKNKQSITNNDILKFDDDVKSATTNNPNWFVIGVFISLVANRINGIGCSFKLTTDNKIYMPPSYVNKECFDAMFTIMSSYNIIYKSLNMKTVTELPENIMRLLYSLKTEYNDIETTERKYDEIIERNSDNNKTIMELKASLTIKRYFIEQINLISYNIMPIAENRIAIMEEDRFRKYIKTLTKKTDLNKKYIMELFPSLHSLIGNMTKNDIWNKYHN